jgi:hypothetical protein
MTHLWPNQVKSGLIAESKMIKRRSGVRAALVLLACCVGFAQTPGPGFEAASIKPSGPIEDGSFVGCSVQNPRKAMADFVRLVAAPFEQASDRRHGKYDFDLWWTFDEPANDRPTMLSAIQSAGLKLESYKGQMEMVVVDHVEKMPTKN